MRLIALLLASSTTLALAAACGGSEKKPPTDPTASLGTGSTSTTTTPPVAGGRSPELAKGMKALEEGQFEAARALFATAVQKDERDFEANYYLAVVYEKLGSKKAAETYYKKTLAIVPGDSGASVNLSAMYLEDKREDEAAALCRDALKKNPMVEKLHFNLARALAAKGDEAGATAEFEQTIKASPDAPDYHLTYGQWLGVWNKREKAIDQVKLALSLAKDDVEVLAVVGRALRVLREAKDCVAVFDRVIAKADAAPARVERGLCKMGMKDGPGAETDLRAAIAADAKAALPHYWLGVLLTGKRDVRGATEQFDAVMQLEPGGELATKAAEKKAGLKRP